MNPLAHTPPPIGQPWPGQGGIYAGIARGRDGQPDCHLILADALPAKPMPWGEARAWAAKVEQEGHIDFSLPTRHESALLYSNVGELFEPQLYWTSTQYSDAAYAWFQYFDLGYQYYTGKGYEARARAVRRFPINPSILSASAAEAAEATS